MPFMKGDFCGQIRVKVDGCTRGQGDFRFGEKNTGGIVVQPWDLMLSNSHLEI